MPIDNALTPEGQNALGAAFGYYPQLKRNRTAQDPQAAKDMLLQFLRGRVAATAGAPSDVLNTLRSPMPMEVFGDVDYGPQQQVPYGSQELLKTLPLPPTSPAGQAAANIGSAVPLTPMEVLQAARATRQAALATKGLPVGMSTKAVGGMNFLRPSDKVIRESFVSGVEAGKELIVHHNISPQKLANVQKVGGMPVPSIAVSNVDNPMLGFGDISLIGSKEMAIPSAKNPVFGFDAYTARAPKIDYEIDTKSRKALEKSLSGIASEIPDGAYSVDRLINNWEDRKYSDVLKAKFLKDEGYALPKIEEFGNEPWRYSSYLSDSVNNLKGQYADWLNKFESSLPEFGVNIKERIFKGFTDMGNRRYAPVTLENLVKEMKGGAGSEGFMYGVGNIRAVATPKFKNLSQVKAARENIITSEKFEPIKKEINSAFDNLTERLNKLEGLSGYRYDAPDALYEIGQTRNVNLLDKIYKNVPPELKADVQVFMSKLREMPTEYFEIKPQRAVQVGEFKGAILPANAPAQSAEYLRSQGLQNLYYYSTPEERKELFKKFGAEMFAAVPALPLGVEFLKDKEFKTPISEKNKLRPTR